MAGPAITVDIKGDASQLGAELDKAGGKVSGFGKGLDVGLIAKATVVGTAIVAVTDVLVGLGQAAGEDRLEADKLAGAIAAAGAATGDWSAQVDAAIDAGAGLAFSDTEIRDALTPLVGVTGDMTRARELLNEAQDIARLKNLDLATAAEAVAKAEGGQAGQLAKLTEVNATGKTATEVLAAAQAKAAGQADIYGKSTKGATEKASIGFSELGEQLGQAVLPILDELLPALLPIIASLSKLVTAVLPILIPLIRLLGTVLGIAARALGVVVDVIATVVGWFAKAIRIVGDFLGSLKGVQDVAGFIGGLFGGSGPSSIGGVTGPGYAGVAGPRANVTVIASGADPDVVVRAVRRWAQVNGGYPAFVRKVSGS